MGLAFGLLYWLLIFSKAAVVVGLIGESWGVGPDISSGLSWRVGGLRTLSPLPLENELLNALTSLAAPWPELRSPSMVSAGPLSINFVGRKRLVQVAAYFGMTRLRWKDQVDRKNDLWTDKKWLMNGKGQHK